MGFSATNSASLFALGYLMTLLLAAPIFLFSPIVGYLCHISFMIGAYLMIGAKYWQGEDTLSINPKELFDTLRKKDVMIIESSSIDDFTITLISDDEVDEPGSADESDESLDEDSGIAPDQKKSA